MTGVQTCALPIFSCIKRRTEFDLNKKQSKLHLLNGLSKILLDIDKAISIIRETSQEANVISNLMDGFSIDQTQAEFVAELKLRHLNKEYILNRTKETSNLEKEIKSLQKILDNEDKIKEIIREELLDIAQKYGEGRKTMLLYSDQIEQMDNEEEILNYPVTVFFTKEGYFKKITPQSLRMSNEQKLKTDDKIIQTIETNNKSELMFFTNMQQVYKAKVSDFSDSKASTLGEYVPAKLQMDENENIIYMLVLENYNGDILFFFENGKVSRVSLDSYETKTNRKKLVNAYSDKSKVVFIDKIENDQDYLLTSTANRLLIMNTSFLQTKSTKNTQGVAVMTLKKSNMVAKVEKYEDNSLSKQSRYKPKNLPASGATFLGQEIQNEQLTFN